MCATHNPTKMGQHVTGRNGQLEQRIHHALRGEQFLATNPLLPKLSAFFGSLGHEGSCRRVGQGWCILLPLRAVDLLQQARRHGPQSMTLTQEPGQWVTTTVQSPRDELRPSPLLIFSGLSLGRPRNTKSSHNTLTPRPHPNPGHHVRQDHERHVSMTKAEVWQISAQHRQTSTFFVP